MHQDPFQSPVLGTCAVCWPTSVCVLHSHCIFYKAGHVMSHPARGRAFDLGHGVAVGYGEPPAAAAAGPFVVGLLCRRRRCPSVWLTAAAALATYEVVRARR